MKSKYWFFSPGVENMGMVSQSLRIFNLSFLVFIIFQYQSFFPQFVHKSMKVSLLNLPATCRYEWFYYPHMFGKKRTAFYLSTYSPPLRLLLLTNT